jgi:hypothetical protein
MGLCMQGARVSALISLAGEMIRPWVNAFTCCVLGAVVVLCAHSLERASVRFVSYIGLLVEMYMYWSLCLCACCVDPSSS